MTKPGTLYSYSSVFSFLILMYIPADKVLKLEHVLFLVVMLKPINKSETYILFIHIRKCVIG